MHFPHWLVLTFPFSWWIIKRDLSTLWLTIVIFLNLLLTVGKLSKSQLSKEQVRVYINEEHNRRRNLLQKYIRLCNEAKVQNSALCSQMTVNHRPHTREWMMRTFFFVPIWQVTVDTVLLESNMTAKAILELITVLNITNLVVGTKRTPCSR